MPAPSSLRLAAALLTIVLAGAGPPARADEPVLPDLVPSTPTSLRLEAECAGDGPVSPWLQDCRVDARRRLLRFDSAIDNMGAGALEVRGSGPQRVDGRWAMSSVVQRLYSGTGVPGSPYRDVAIPAAMVHETADGHDHFHVTDAVRYELTSPEGDRRLSAKAQVGFCLRDNEQAGDGPLSPSWYSPIVGEPPYCGTALPQAPSVTMGISPGWRDLYDWTLPFQWIDVSDAQPGPYRLGSTVNPQGVLIERDTTNNASSETSVDVVLPGHRALPLTSSTGVNRSIALRLPVATYEANVLSYATFPPGPTEVEVVDRPAHGTVDAPGGWSSGREVRYTPRPGFRGTDSFTFRARDSANPGFPRTPAVARVSITVGQPTQGEVP